MAGWPNWPAGKLTGWLAGAGVVAWSSDNLAWFISLVNEATLSLSVAEQQMELAPNQKMMSHLGCSLQRFQNIPTSFRASEH